MISYLFDRLSSQLRITQYLALAEYLTGITPMVTSQSGKLVQYDGLLLLSGFLVSIL